MNPMKRTEMVDLLEGLTTESISYVMMEMDETVEFVPVGFVEGDDLAIEMVVSDTDEALNAMKAGKLLEIIEASDAENVVLSLNWPTEYHSTVRFFSISEYPDEIIMK